MNEAARITQLEARLERLEATVHTRADVSGWSACAIKLFGEFKRSA